MRRNNKCWASQVGWVTKSGFSEYYLKIWIIETLLKYQLIYTDIQIFA